MYEVLFMLGRLVARLAGAAFTEGVYSVAEERHTEEERRAVPANVVPIR